MAKRMEFHGFVEVPDGFLEDVEDPLGWIVEIKSTRGIVTSNNRKLTEKDSGERTKTTTLGLRLVADTKLGKIHEPVTPVMEGQESLDNVRPIAGE